MKRSETMKRCGTVLFAFFFLKGMAWLAAAGAAWWMAVG